MTVTPSRHAGYMATPERHAPHDAMRAAPRGTFPRASDHSCALAAVTLPSVMGPPARYAHQEVRGMVAAEFDDCQRGGSTPERAINARLAKAGMAGAHVEYLGPRLTDCWTVTAPMLTTMTIADVTYWFGQVCDHAQPLIATLRIDLPDLERYRWWYDGRTNRMHDETHHAAA